MRDRGQATIEAIAAFPVCLLAAWTLVETGVVVRERVALSHAASRAAVAQLEGSDAADAARAAVGPSLAKRLRITVSSGEVVVFARPRVKILGVAGVGALSSAVDLQPGVVR